ncbi:hypothetical protein OC842_000649 [Tilletia horrida]|uniref:DUF6589 domain-containing protein n=1 Tax=Tilletia horrida TaxID=155126 RepID=A0AAN6GGG4_9BASI|nr:hypothetical protein OC842_000649 [Tilletia horrida]
MSEPRQRPADYFVGIPSSSVHGSPSAALADAAEADLDDLFSTSEDEDEQDGPPSAGPSTPLPTRLQQQRKAQAKKPARAKVLNDLQLLELLRYLRDENLSLAAILRAFFDPAKPKEPKLADYSTEDSPHRSKPSTYQVTAHYMHWRVSRWLTDEGDVVGKRWKGMDEFATAHIAELIAKEAKKAINEPYLRGPSAHAIEVDQLEQYDPRESARIIEAECPILQRMLDAAVGKKEEETPKGKQPALKKRKTVHLPEALDLLDTDESDDEESAETTGAQGQKQEKRRWYMYGQRSKANVASTLSHIALFARSKRCNMFQQSLGLMMHAARVPKRALELLSRAGVIVSPDSIKNMTTSLADGVMERAKVVIHRVGNVISISIDNMNWILRVRDPTATHRNKMQAAVVGEIYHRDEEVQIDPQQPTCSEQLHKQLFGSDVPRLTTDARPVSPLGQDGRPLAMDRAALAQARMTVITTKDVATHRDFLLNAHDQEHLVQCTVSHALRTFVEGRPELGHLLEKVKAPPQVFPLVPKKTTVLPLPVYDEDEGSIAGNIKVIEHVCKDFALSEEWLASHVLPAIGDAFTATLQRKAIERRQDDRSNLPERDRLRFLYPLAALFHTEFSFLKYAIDTHAGTSSNMDLVSLRRVSDRAGLKTMTTGNVDFHEADAFMHLNFTAMTDAIIADALREAGHGDGTDADRTLVGEDPDETLASHDAAAEAHEGDEETADAQASGSGGAGEGDDAARGNDGIASADAAAEDGEGGSRNRAGSDQPMREQKLALPIGGRRNTKHAPDEFRDLEWDALYRATEHAITKLMRGRIYDLSTKDAGATSDLLFAHAVTVFRDTAVYIELRHAIKHGDPGRAMAMLRQALPRFQSNGQHRYVTECLELLFALLHELPPALKQVVLASCLVNKSGHPDSFMPADLAIEHKVHDMKNVFPVQAKSGGLAMQRRIGELHPLLAATKEKWYRAYSIKSVDSSHATRDKTFTRKALSDELVEYAVFQRQDKDRQSPVFELRHGDKRAASGDKRKTKQAKHVATDTVVSGTAALVGSAFKPGSITRFLANKQDPYSVGTDLVEEETEAGVRINFDVERDMYGDLELDLDTI